MRPGSATAKSGFWGLGKGFQTMYGLGVCMGLLLLLLLLTITFILLDIVKVISRINKKQKHNSNYKEGEGPSCSGWYWVDQSGRHARRSWSKQSGTAE